jgi:hypothetical protein
MNTYSKDYYDFIENEKIDISIVDETIDSLSLSSGFNDRKNEIYEYPSPALRPVNWILYIKSPKYSCNYVKNYSRIINQNNVCFPSIDLIIKKWHHYSKESAELAIEYINFMSESFNIDKIKKYFSLEKNYPSTVAEAMPLIAKNSFCSLKYSLIKEQRFLEGENSIFEDANNTFIYLERVLKGKIPNEILSLVESAISKDSFCSLNYALNYKKCVFPQGEKSISKDGECSLSYAKNIIKGRFELGEKSISSRDDLLLYYSVAVLGERLPESMHKKMSLKSFAK